MFPKFQAFHNQFDGDNVLHIFQRGYGGACGTYVEEPKNVAAMLQWITPKTTAGWCASTLCLDGTALDEQAIFEYLTSDDGPHHLSVTFWDESLMRAVCTALWYSIRLQGIQPWFICRRNQVLTTAFEWHMTLAYQLRPTLWHESETYFFSLDRPIGMMQGAKTRARELGHPTMQNVCWYWLLDPRRPKKTVLYPDPE